MNRFIEDKATNLPLLILASFPFVVAFFLIPISMYIPNQEDFHYNFLMLAPYLSLLTVSFMLLAAVNYLWPTFSGKAFPVLFYLGLFLMLSDIVAPLKVGEIMMGWDAAPVPEPALYIVFEACLAFAVAVIWYLLPKRHLLKYIPPVTVLLVVMQLAYLFMYIDLSSYYASKETGSPTLEYSPEKQTDKPNIYHITFDGFSGDGFLELLRDVSSDETFEGFYYFPRNKANYLFTWISRSSYMTGTIYRDGSLQAWLDRWKKDGLFSEVKDAGYVITEYSSSAAEDISFSRQKAVDADMSLTTIDHVHLADLWILRLVPTVLRQEVFRSNENKGVATFVLKRFFLVNSLDSLPIRHKAQVDLLIEDEAKRPARGQYVWAHPYIPHGPFNLTSNCEYQASAGYDEQAKCTIRLMVNFLNELKRQNKYHSSMIIFHADHGSFEVGKSEMSPDIEKRINADSASGRSAQEVLNLTSSLLLIKPPYSSGAPLKVSDRLTQLADIPATIHGLLGINHARVDGINVFGGAYDAERSIEVYAGYIRKGEDGGWMRFGKAINSGYFDHYSYSLQEGWEIKEKIPVSW